MQEGTIRQETTVNEFSLASLLSSQLGPDSEDPIEIMYCLPSSHSIKSQAKKSPVYPTLSQANSFSTHLPSLYLIIPNC